MVQQGSGILKSPVAQILKIHTERATEKVWIQGI